MNHNEILNPFFCLRSTPFGPVVVFWSVLRDRPRIGRVLLSRPGVSAETRAITLFPYAVRSSCGEVDLLAEDIDAFLHGEAVRFSLDLVRLDLCSMFQQEVLRAEYHIPRGAVSSYQGIAKHLGRVQGARAVGTALAGNPFPIIIPCHRAIRMDGSLGGYQGGLEMKRALLEMEGMEFDENGRAKVKRFYYG